MDIKEKCRSLLNGTIIVAWFASFWIGGFTKSGVYVFFWILLSGFLIGNPVKFAKASFNNLALAAYRLTTVGSLLWLIYGLLSGTVVYGIFAVIINAVVWWRGEKIFSKEELKKMEDLKKAEEIENLKDMAGKLQDEIGELEGGEGKR